MSLRGSGREYRGADECCAAGAPFQRISELYKSCAVHVKIKRAASRTEVGATEVIDGCGFCNADSAAAESQLDHRRRNQCSEVLSAITEQKILFQGFMALLMLPDFSARATVVLFYLGGQFTEGFLFPESF